MYFIALPKKKLYGYYAEKEGYYSVSKNADLRKPGKKKEFRYDITLVKAQDLAAMPSVPINNIFFEYDSFELQSESFPELQRLALFLRENPAMRIEIAGHTDDQGTDAYNQTLSQRRAESVRDYLVKSGCNAGAISARGYGKSKPLAAGATDEARAQNRRVEFRATEKK
jgi:outer membrane protein OmpA-like peptidoglycan-associated protein